MRMARVTQISVIGGSRCSSEVLQLAKETGAEIARRGGVLVCGGLGGVMGAAATGAREMGGLTIGILPSYAADTAHPSIDVVIPTGMSHARNLIVVAAGDAVIALAGEDGTASEIALARLLGRPVVALRAWEDVEDIVFAHSAADAVDAAMARAAARLP
jgi:uncharacterized protein (TIGR00725 family)